MTLLAAAAMHGLMHRCGAPQHLAAQGPSLPFQSWQGGRVGIKKWERGPKEHVLAKSIQITTNSPMLLGRSNASAHAWLQCATASAGSSSPCPCHTKTGKGKWATTSGSDGEEESFENCQAFDSTLNWIDGSMKAGVGCNSMGSSLSYSETLQSTLFISLAACLMSNQHWLHHVLACAGCPDKFQHVLPHCSELHLLNRDALHHQKLHLSCSFPFQVCSDAHASTHPSECILQESDTGAQAADAARLKEVISRCGALASERPKSLFSARDLETDLGRLLKGGNVEQHRDVLERPLAASALAGKYPPLLLFDGYVE